MPSLLSLSCPFFNNQRNGVMVEESKYLKVIFSKLSILFLIIVGGITSINIYILTQEYSRSRPICLINDLIPPALDYHRLAMPIALLCRSIEFSLVINYIQIFLSVVAVYGSLKGKKILYIICFNFIIVLITFGGLFLGVVVIIISKKLVLKSTFTLFFILYQDDDEFCLVIEPVLKCRQYNIRPINKSNEILRDIPFDGDIIEEKCGVRSSNIEENENDCIEYLTNVTLSHKWVIYISIMYFLFLTIVIVQIMRIISCSKRNNKYFGKFIRNIRRGEEHNLEVEEGEEEENDDEDEKIIKSDIIIEDNNNRSNDDVQEFEMITIYLNDKQYKDNEDVEFL
uniref:G_PROTEIN_RECEP_F1_2 domain-containing protein n=1 Tax=Strongyloides venezuelensis TaxID=75913 RepID=A0A0K0F2Y3_STRVS